MNAWIGSPSPRSTNMLERTVAYDVPRRDVRIKVIVGESVLDL